MDAGLNSFKYIILMPAAFSINCISVYLFSNARPKNDIDVNMFMNV